MAFTVTTYNDEAELATALIGQVETYNSEAKLQAALDVVVNFFAVVAKGAKFTLIHNIELSHITLDILAKGAKFTVVHQT